MTFTDPLETIACSRRIAAVDLRVTRGADAAADAGSVPLIWPVAPGGPLPSGITWEWLHGNDFRGVAGSVMHLRRPGEPDAVLAGVGADSGPDQWRDAAGLASRALSPATHVRLRLVEASGPDQARAAVEGALLARYRYDALRAEPQGHALVTLDLLVAGPDGDTGEQGEEHDGIVAAAREAVAYAAATALTRDLSNTPHNHLTATRFADVAVALAAEVGVEAEVYDQERIVAEGLGAVLAVNAGSLEQARVVVVRYRPAGPPTGRLALVGKGIMYDSGGIGLKPNNDSHAQMKNDMTGAAAVLGAILALPALGGTAEVSGYLMCTDNMPSASATALGDVVRGRSGRTIEIIDTDAEGRLVLSDGISLAVEDGVDAVVDIATLTGSVARAFGSLLAGLAGSDEPLVAAVEQAAAAEGEPVARLPLEAGYRDQIDSPVADLRNVAPVGVPDGIIAALFLHEFTDGVPWAHLDIAGTAWSTVDAGWRTPGCSGPGARTLLSLARTFTR